MSRINLLKGFLEQNPDDSFSRYALALECTKLGELDQAQKEFETVLQKDPDYLATYYQLGQLYLRRNLRHEAEKTFRTGIAVAVKQNDAHTQSELEAALESIL